MSKEGAYFRLYMKHRRVTSGRSHCRGLMMTTKFSLERDQYRKLVMTDTDG